ncbi:MAG: hypothetical protein ACOCZ8_02540 [Bacteroidota bacterium]
MSVSVNKKTIVLLLAFQFALLASSQTFAQCVALVTADCTTGCDFTVSGANMNVNVNFTGPNQKLCILSGASITGSLNINFNGGSGPTAQIVNCGTIDINNLNTNSGTWINNGTLDIAGSFAPGGNTRFMNYGDWLIGGDLNPQNTTEIYNDGYMAVDGNFNMNGAFQNAGLIDVSNTWQQNDGDVCLESGSEISANLLLMNNGTISGSGGCMHFGNGSSVVQGGTLSGTIDLCDNGGPVSTSGSGTIDPSVTTCTATGCDAVLPILFSSVQLNTTPNRLELQWLAQTPATGEERYWVQQGAAPSQLNDLDYLPATGQPGEIHQYVYTLPKPTATTYYRVVEEDLSGARRFSRVLSYTPADALPRVVVQTAPGQLTLSCEEAVPVQVITVTGRRVFDGQLHTRTKLSGLSSGVYVLKTPHSVQRIALQ